MLDFTNRDKPIYLQIAEDICDKVLAAIFAPDERIPSVREYAAMVEVNVNTVMRAYDHLAGLGIIYNKRGLGFFTSADARQRVTEMRREELFNDGIKKTFRQLSMLGVSPEQLRDMYLDFITKQQSEK